MNPKEKEYDLTGRLSEDGRSIIIDHAVMLKNLLKRVEGIELDIRIKPLKEKRSDAQNKYFWAVVIPYIKRYLEESTGERYTSDEIYAWVRLSLLGVKPKVVEMLGEEIIIMEDKRFSKMTTKEFAETVDLIRAKMLEKGLDIPEPTTNNHLYEHVGNFKRN